MECDCEEVLNGLIRYLPRLGITRVGDLTGLDVIGVPVWFACRPNARSLSVSQGKGLSHAAARISAIMEAIEQHFAECSEGCEIDFTGSYREACHAGKAVVPLQAIAGFRPSHFDPDRDRLWCKGISLLTGEPVSAPFDLVGLDFRVDAPWDRKAFRMSTVGLGAGCTRDQATLHALLEVIENDATTLVDALGPLSPFLSRVRVDAAEGEPLMWLMARVEQAGLRVKLVRLHGLVGLPVLGAFIEEPSTGPARLVGATAAGYACRLSPAEAAGAALMEAIQSRLSDIAGARDDIDPAVYTPRNPRPTIEAVAAEAISALEAAAGQAALVTEASAALQHVLVACVQAGVDDMFAFNLGGAELGVSVVRVMAPGLDHVAEGGPVDLGVGGLHALLATAGLR